jgi:hypothetical protein
MKASQQPGMTSCETDAVLGPKGDKILQAGLDYLRLPGRKLATIGFRVADWNRSMPI